MNSKQVRIVNPLATGVAAAVVAILAGCATASSHSAGRTDGPQPGALDAGSVAYPQLTGAERARADSAQHPWTEADAHFMSSMIGHHAQAIVMSRLAPENSSSRSIRTLAARIINAQHDEIALMQTWLRNRGQPVPDPGDTLSTGGGMPGHDAHAGHAGHDMDHASMPGMLTNEELAQLEAARGVDFDRMFLSFMIRHHQGAVTMVEELFATDGAGQDESVFRLATDINVDQITEIERMGLMLVELLTEGSLP